MRPGKEISKRPLNFFWITDSSGSMSIDGKIQSLNNAIKEAVPHMKSVANENPFAKLNVRAIKFSHGASWHIEEPTDINDFKWIDIDADPLTKSSSGNVDIVFLIDTSGSMSGEIESVKNSCTQFADKIIKEGANVRLGLVGFDIGGHRKSNTNVNYKVKNLSRYTIGTWDLTDPISFKTNIQTLSLGLFGGAGCYIANQDTVDVFPEVVKVFDNNSKNKKILIIISDEIGDNSGINQIVDILKKEDVTSYVLGVPGKAHKQIAKQTGGEFWNIMQTKGVKDFSDLLENVGETIAKEVTKTLSDGTVSHGTDMGLALKLLGTKLTIPPMADKALPPVIVLISDGYPTDNFNDELNDLMKLNWAKKAVRLAIAIGKDTDMSVLQKFIGHKEIKPLQANNPEQLTHFIKWVSTVVIKAVSNPPSDPRNKEEGKGNVAIPDVIEVDITDAEDVW